MASANIGQTIRFSKLQKGRSAPTMHEIQEMRLGLRQQLEQLEMKRRQIDEAIIEFQRRISGLGEAMDWRPVAAESYQQMQQNRREAGSVHQG